MVHAAELNAVRGHGRLRRVSASLPALPRAPRVCSPAQAKPTDVSAADVWGHAPSSDRGSALAPLPGTEIGVQTPSQAARKVLSSQHKEEGQGLWERESAHVFLWPAASILRRVSFHLVTTTAGEMPSLTMLWALPGSNGQSRSVWRTWSLQENREEEQPR